MVYAILIAYIALTFLTSLIGNKQQAETPESYFLADRGLHPITLFFTLIATNFSAFFFLGFAGEGYRIGYAYYAMMAFGTAFAAVSFYLIGNKAWHLGKERGYITPVEMIEDMSQSRLLKFAYLLVFLIFTFPYLALQPIGAGYILASLTDGAIPYFAGASLLTIFIIVYVFVGGMRSVASTDVKQGILMISLMLAAVLVVSNSLGGLTKANEAVFAIKPELFSHGGANNYFTPQKWFSLCILWLACVPMFPQLFMRFFISKKLSGFKISTVLYALIPSVLFLLPVIIGVLGHLSFPGLEGKAADQILPKMLLEHSPEWFATLVMTGALAAFMSTLDSQLLALSTITTRDVYLPYINPKASLSKQVNVGKLFVVIYALIGLAIAYSPFDTIFDIAKMAFTGLAVLFVPTLAIFYFKKTNPTVCALAIFIGEFILLGMYLKWIPKTWFGGFEAIVPILFISTLIIWIGSTIFPKR